MSEDEKPICPRVGCEKPYSYSIARTNEPFKQSTMNMTFAQMCYIPMYVDGKPGIAMVYHTYDDLAHGDFEIPRWGDEDDIDWEADVKTPDDLPEDHKIVFEIIRKATAGEYDESRKSILAGECRRKCIEAGIPKERMRPIVVNLIYQGFVREITDAVFQAVPEAVV